LNGLNAKVCTNAMEWSRARRAERDGVRVLVELNAVL
jgi:hypothetical protein